MMEYLTANNIIFALLSAVILICALLSVTTNKLLRAAIYLFFALIGIAGLYLQLSYEFLAAVELSVYAGGIVILFVFAIFLVHRIGENSEEVSLSKKAIAGLAAAAGVALCLSTLFMYEYTTFHLTPEAQMNAETSPRPSHGHDRQGPAGHWQASIPAAFRGNRHPAAGLHHRFVGDS
jgi:NADH-quinone oxidoreductase subunit J